MLSNNNYVSDLSMLLRCYREGILPPPANGFAPPPELVAKYINFLFMYFSSNLCPPPPPPPPPPTIYFSKHYFAHPEIFSLKKMT